jgi:NADH-quinone oxidoreductase subunit K
MTMNIGLSHYLVVSALLLGCGLYTVVTRRNAVAILMGVELILNAAILNLVAFSRFVSGDIAGHVFGLFGIVLAASEAVVALAIVLQLYRTLHSIDAAEATELKQ